MKRAAIIDIGSNRVKLKIYSDNEIQSFSYNTYLKEKIDSGDHEEAVNSMESSLKLIKNKIQYNKINSYIVTGSAILRSSKCKEVLHNTIEDNIGCYTILTPYHEALLFFEAVRELDPFDEVAALDVGGGSSQLIWGLNNADYRSGNIGTASLQKKYQKNNKIILSPDSTDWLEMAEEVKSIFSNKDYKISKRKLVVGSNFMNSFLKALAIYLDKPLNDDYSFTKKNLLEIINEIKDTPYSSHSSFFPMAPRFIEGVDKLFVNIISATDSLNCEIIVGTDKSISDGIFKIFLNKRTDLMRYNLKINKMHS